MPQTQSRVVGSGNTILLQNGREIAFLASVDDAAPKPVGTTAVIQPLDAKHPVEIVTSNAVGAGTLTLRLVELWDAEAWQRLVNYENAQSILDVYEANRGTGQIQFKKIIKAPNGRKRGKVYMGCIITNVTEDESVTIDQMTKSVTVTVQYTHVAYV
jgi:hypothetical protein